MLLDNSTASLLSHRLNNNLATLILSADIIAEERDEEMLRILQVTVKEMTKFWAYFNYLYRGKDLKIKFNEGFLEPITGLPLLLSDVFIYELYTGGLKNGAENYSVRIEKSTDGKNIITYSDDGTGLTEKNISELGKLQTTGTGNCGLGLLVLSKLAEQCGYKLYLDENCAKLIEY